VNNRIIKRIQVRTDRAMAAAGIKDTEKRIGYRLCIAGTLHDHIFSVPVGRGLFLDKSARAEGLTLVSLSKCPDGVTPNWQPKAKADKNGAKVDSATVLASVDAVDLSDLSDDDTDE